MQNCTGEDAYESTAGTLATIELAGHSDSVASLGFNHNGTLLATGGMDGEEVGARPSSGLLVCYGRIKGATGQGQQQAERNKLYMVDGTCTKHVLAD